jgi:hypothetical protein
LSGFSDSLSKEVVTMRLATQASNRLFLAVVAAGLAGLLTFLVLSDVSAASSKSPFVGYWTATDNDGSHLELWVRGGPRPTHVKIADDLAHSCSPAGPATGMGKAELTADDEFSIEFRVRCEDHSQTTVSRTFTYEPDTDDLVDSSHVSWTRG